MANIPLKPDRVVDFTWGLSLFFSKDEQERKFGEYVRNKWEALTEKHKADADASKYFDNVNALMFATIEHLAQVRSETNEGFAYLDALQKRKMENLGDLVKLSRDAESIATRIAGLTVGAGVSFLQLATNVIGAREVILTLLGAGISYILLEIGLRLYRIYKAPKIITEIEEKKKKFKEEQSQPKTKEIVTEFLKKLSEISEETYKSKIEEGEITVLAKSYATLQSGSYFTSGSIPTHLYTADPLMRSAYSGGAVSPLNAGRFLGTNYDKNSENKE